MNRARRCVCCGGTHLKSTPSTIAPFIIDRVFDGINVPNHSLFCDNCGLIFLDIRFSPDEMNKLYKNYRCNKYTIQRELHEPGYTERNNKLLLPCRWLSDIEKFIENHVELPVKILDWGGNDGVNSPFRGSRILHIYDIGDNSPQDGEKVSIPVGQYDLIVCASVLEHLPYPNQTIEEIRKIATENTIIYFDAPLGYAGRNIWHEHINIFNPYALRLLIESCGFDIIDVQSLENPELLQVICKRRL